jgi:hypothetical protein
MILSTAATHDVLERRKDIGLEAIEPEEGESDKDNSTRPADGAIAFYIQTTTHISFS